MRPEYGSYNDRDPGPQPPLHLHALPKGHGPASSSTRISTVRSLSSLEYAPKFVKSVGAYDELGRSLGDGVGAGVVEGNAKAEGEGLTFWKNLELGPSRVVSRTSTPLLDPPPSAVNPTPTTSTIPSPTPTPTTIIEREPLVRPTAPTLHVPREQWFIRRALLAKDQKARETDSSEAPTPPTRPVTPSLASMLSDALPPPPNTGSSGEEVEGYRPPAYFHLKPSNRGWRVLKNIGWDERGGLGRGEGTPREGRSKGGEGKGKQVAVKDEDGRCPAMDVEEQPKGTTGATNDSAIDLTLDSECESDLEQCQRRSKSISPSITSQNTSEPSSSRPLSSGRTAPVATYLKTDLRGIGALSASERRRALLRPGTLAAASASSRKRVTHSQEEIRAAVRGSKVNGEGLSGEKRVAFEKRRGKRDAKRDREERQRWRAAIDL
ncbi:hypothetical protein NCC49_000024 [Naganishia albida]|nr:hypothetical protein NCC49_000024 [Naganishia albida]